MYQKF